MSPRGQKVANCPAWLPCTSSRPEFWSQCWHDIANSNSQREASTRTVGAPACWHCWRVRMTTHIRYPRAAVATGRSDSRNASPLQSPRRPESGTPVVLWASHAHPVHSGGRLVGVRRLSSAEIEVAWVEPGHAHVQWVSAALMLNEYEARRWLARARARFSRQ
jgi:hypothetical protein